MKIGSLVCYNAAGMKKKTIGIILDISGDSHNKRYLLIDWFMEGKYKPRWSFGYYNQNNHLDPVWDTEKREFKKFLWYENGNWIEVLNNDI